MCPQGSLRADFYFSGHISSDTEDFHAQGTFFAFSGQSTNNKTLNWHRRFPCLGHIQGTQGTQGTFFDITFLKIQKLKIVKFEKLNFIKFEKLK